MNYEFLVVILAIFIASFVLNQALTLAMKKYTRKKGIDLTVRFFLISTLKSLISSIAFLAIIIIIALQIPFIQKNAEPVIGSLSQDSGKIFFNILLALFLIYVVWKLAQVSMRLASVFVARRIGKRAPTRTILKGLRYIMFFLLAILVLPLAGLNITPLLATAGIAGIVIGLALQPIVASLLSGIFIMHDKPYEVGDKIELKGLGIIGVVEDINIRTTKIRTVQGNIIIITNSNMLNRDIVNYTTDDARVRIDTPITITYESDVLKAIDIIVNAVKTMPGGITEGTINIRGMEVNLAPIALIKNFGDHGIELEMRYWVDDFSRHWKGSTSEILKKVFADFKANGIDIAYPHTQLVFDAKTLDSLARRK